VILVDAVPHAQVDGEALFGGQRGRQDDLAVVAVDGVQRPAVVFDIDETALPAGVAMMTALAFDAPAHAP